MGLFKPEERAFAEAVGALGYENPFTPARMERERAALGRDFSDAGTTWAAEDGALPEPGAPERPNLRLLRERSAALADACLERLTGKADATRRRVTAGRRAGEAGPGSSEAARARASDADLRLYEDVALYALFARHESELYRLSLDDGPKGDTPRFAADFARDFARWLEPPGVRLPSGLTMPHVLAVFFQIRRAFHHVHRSIFGASPAVARLRASVWESVFTRDLRRYRDSLWSRMQDVPTLVTGESGTGKELVARAIGLSRYVPFDPGKQRFAVAFGLRYFALSLSALSPTLIESELFGHLRGSFTGALDDRAGYLDAAGEHGTVFLDEIGELEPALQVKLLRVLQTRDFSRNGDTRRRAFRGKLVAATNRDLATELRAGRFREDLYYRICADRIEAPTLRERLADDPDELPRLVRLIATRVAGEEAAGAVTRDVLALVERRLGPAYAWPGNVRELEQCVRAVLVRGDYQPLPAAAEGDRAALDRALAESGLGATELTRRYCSLVYAQTRSFVETGRRLGLDRRTVKEHLDPVLLAALGVTLAEP